MSMFSWLPGPRRKRLLQKLSKYVDVARFQELLDNPESVRSWNSEREIGFLFLRVRDDKLEVLDNLIARAVDRAAGTVEGLLGPVVVMTFGSALFAPEPMEKCREKMLEAIEAIRTELQGAAAIFYGIRRARVGLYGGLHVARYASVFPGYSDVLRELTAAPLGTVREFDADAHGGATRSMSQEDSGSQTRSD